MLSREQKDEELGLTRLLPKSLTVHISSASPLLEILCVIVMGESSSSLATTDGITAYGKLENII